MEEANILEALNDLQREVKTLKAFLKTESLASATRFQRLARWVIANWVLVSFLAAVTTATYVKFRYGVDYLETYRCLAATKELSDFYRQLGDRLMISSQWDAAKKAYRAAVKLNPNNIGATYGIAKAEVFDPLPGQKFYTPEVVDAKLAYLESRFPNDHEIYFLKSLRYQDKGELARAKAALNTCIEKNPKYIGCYIDLGILNQQSHELDKAIANFARATDLDPDSSTAKNDLGFCRLLLLDYSGAIAQLSAAYEISPNMLTAINLGDAYRYSGDLGNALTWHRQALEALNEMKTPGDQERYVQGTWLYNFMPLAPGDRKAIKESIEVYTLKQKEAIAHYGICIDLALLDRLDDAAKEFVTGLELEHGLPFKEFLQNKMLSSENLGGPAPEEKQWLDTHRDMINSY
jgi:tetratricopeptide (TPR) repeat protein